MWLLHTTALRLQFFPSSDGQKYGILSHTWGKDEFSYQAMRAFTESSVPTGRGWAKITATCEKARSEFGLDWVWIDTCCIDKTSSAELTEAINSMFSWYKDAAVCLVFLEDFPGVDGSNTPDPDGFRQRLGQCRWFTRGWTLQELIAPSEVVFYNADWDPLGTKAGLINHLSAITAIDQSVLHGMEALHFLPVCKKMAWAASRQTTRIEDLAYCLLGIFGINMPMLYGEGDKAFIRLQEQIARSGNDLTLFAWTQEAENGTNTIKPRGIFATSPAEFRHCNTIKAPDIALEKDVEFSMTNQGLRIHKNLGRHPGGLYLGLDCVDCSERTGGKPRWLSISLKMIRFIHVRDHPHKLFYSGDARYGGYNAGPIHVPATLPQPLAEMSGLIPSVGIVYTNSLRKRLPRSAQKQLRTIRLTPEARLVHIDPSNMARPVAPLADQRQCLGQEVFQQRDYFATQGFRCERAHHLFDVELDPADSVTRLAVLWGTTWIKEPEGGSGLRNKAVPWAALLHHEALSKLQGCLICHPRLFDATDSISELQRLRIFYEYIFQNYADDAGELKMNNLPTVVSIAGRGAKHEVHVGVGEGILGADGFTLVLSYTRKEMSVL